MGNIHLIPDLSCRGTIVKKCFRNKYRCFLREIEGEMYPVLQLVINQLIKDGDGRQLEVPTVFTASSISSPKIVLFQAAKAANHHHPARARHPRYTSTNRRREGDS